MKNPIEVLWMKEQELSKVRKEVEALRITSRLLSDEDLAGGDAKQELRQQVEMPPQRSPITSGRLTPA
jgi:hypothetical protein